jgi:mRNA-degrading endonuclease RelE of RelBE toxin-antitoxin system
LTETTTVLQTSTFKKAVKKFHKNQKKDLDTAVRELLENPLLGEQKKGDLAFIRVYKFNMINQLTLLGYSYEEGTVTLELMVPGSHENFYRDAKKVL